MRRVVLDTSISMPNDPTVGASRVETTAVDKAVVKRKYSIDRTKADGGTSRKRQAVTQYCWVAGGSRNVTPPSAQPSAVMTTQTGVTTSRDVLLPVNKYKLVRQSPTKSAESKYKVISQSPTKSAESKYKLVRGSATKSVESPNLSPVVADASQSRRPIHAAANRYRLSRTPPGAATNASLSRYKFVRSASLRSRRHVVKVRRQSPRTDWVEAAANRVRRGYQRSRYSLRRKSAERRESVFTF